MAEPSSGFLKWAKAKYPKDWQRRVADPALYFEWQREVQRKARLEAAIKWEAPQAVGTTLPPATPPATGERNLKWFVPGQVTIDVNTGKYYDELGDNEITAQDAQAIRVKYDEQIAPEEQKEPTARWTIPGTEVISSGGYDWLKKVDQQGNVSYEVVGKTPAPEQMGMTDWEKAQIAQRQAEQGQAAAEAKAKLDWEKLVLTEQTKQEMATLEDRRFAARIAGFEAQGRKPWLGNPEYAAQFERDRATLLAGIPSDDWIRQWTVQNQPNPYKPQEVNPADELEWQLDRQTAAVQFWENEAVLAQLAVTGMAMGKEGLVMGNITATDPREIKRQVERRDQALEAVKSAQEARDKSYNLWNTLKKENADWTPQPLVPQPYPSAPSWLPEFVPGLQAGKMISKQFVPTPSGQQLTRMAPSQVSQLGAYSDWAGGRQLKDILAEAEIMQPRSPSWRQTRWTPVGR